MSQSEFAVLVQKIDDMKEFFVDKFERVGKDIDEKCAKCQNAPTFRERLRSQWFHICALWTALAGACYIGYEFIINSLKSIKEFH